MLSPAMVHSLLKQFGFDPEVIQRQVQDYAHTIQDTLQRIDAKLETIVNKQNEHERLLFQLMKDKAEDERIEEMMLQLPTASNGGGSVQPQYGHTEPGA